MLLLLGLPRRAGPTVCRASDQEGLLFRRQLDCLGSFTVLLESSLESLFGC